MKFVWFDNDGALRLCDLSSLKNIKIRLPQCVLRD